MVRFAGVGRVSIEALIINLRVPDLSWNIEDFHKTSDFPVLQGKGNDPAG